MSSNSNYAITRKSKEENNLWLKSGGLVSHGFQCRSSSLLRGRPLGRKVFGASDLGEFFLVSLRPPKLFHTVVNCVCQNRIGRKVRQPRPSPLSGFVLLLTDNLAIVLVDVLPAEDLLCRQDVELRT